MSDSFLTLKERLQADVKSAMKSGDKARLGTLRLAMAAIKQREVDERVELDDAAVIAVLDKMLKQRRESISQYEKGGRQDLAEIERAEIDVLQPFLPQPLSEAELTSLIEDALNRTAANAIGDMGKVMAILKPALQGRADLAAVSKTVRTRLGA
ncbi:GatB/YqeY domain-containing protein [Methylolobus aquaticus]|nr:GatB/YqeY domain-containing protein [Methylolobus aquaticus]